MKRFLLLIATAVAIGAVPATGSAATLNLTAGTGPANEDFIIYRASKREQNRLTLIAGRNTLTFKDTGTSQIKRAKGSFSGCSFKIKKRVVCKTDPATDVVIYLGDKNDKLSFKGKANRTGYGETERTEATTSDLADFYEDSEGGNTEHLYVDAGAGNDLILGTRFHDVVYPGAGEDTVDTGAGDDRIVLALDKQLDGIIGGSGIDTVDVTGTQRVTIDLENQTVGAGSESDELDSIERAHGSDGDDTLLGSTGRDGLFGDSGSDTIDGKDGNDYLGGDLDLDGPAKTPGIDTLTGGPGDDVLDGRDADTRLTPTDMLGCGDGSDQVIGRVDDLVDATCELSLFGVFNGDLYFEQSISFGATNPIAPVSRAADRSPTYAILCPPSERLSDPCTGVIRIERAPFAADNTNPTVLGSATFTIGHGEIQNVTVPLNAEGAAVATQSGSLASVHVLMGAPANAPPSGQPGTAPGPDADYGWQAPLGP